ncbi:MAG: GGDEF domain-containing protein [Miltoncostaeaceae bacterium]
MPTPPADVTSTARRASGGVTTPRRGPQIADWSGATRALAGFYGAGALMALLIVLLPHDPSLDQARILLQGGICAAVAVGVAMGPRPGVVAQNLLVAGGTVLITLGIDAQGATHTGFAYTYVLAMLYAAVFFRPWAAGLHVAFAAACFGALLILKPTESGVTDWLILTITLATAGAVISRIHSVADGVSAALAEAARTDPLTGAANRRAYHEGLADELGRTRRTGEPLALLLCDIDHFKTINDTHGHDEGDEVLKAVVGALGEQRRTGDLVARLGGEEFALVLPRTDLGGGIAAAERARRAVHDAVSAHGLDVTMSVGLAIHPDAGTDAESLLRAADRALYSAKDLGRDRCVVAGATASPHRGAGLASAIAL